MKKLTIRIGIAIVSLYLCTISVFAAEVLIPVGEVIGLELYNDTVIVVAFDDHCTAAREAGLQIGDEILSIDGQTVDCAEDVRQGLTRSDGSVDLAVRRGEDTLAVHLRPDISPNGPKMGVYLRQGITGIGTVTYYDPQTGDFGTLGHGVNDSSGTLLTMTRGNVYPASVVAVQRGKTGAPGLLKGALGSNQLLGTLSVNCSRGVFGKAPHAWQGKALPCAEYAEIHTGAATIRSTIDAGAPKDYSVEILKIYPKSRTDGRNFVLKVTDPDLLAATGGIVQGMSGSPIIQDGKLVGAVTHVLVNDPTRGYGIFIENMLKAAE